jgi:sRNA-binding regulator protein Hfq
MMDVRKYAGKKVLIILKNGFQYTAVIPNFSGDNFRIKDKFGKEIEICSDYVAFLSEAEE